MTENAGFLENIEIPLCLAVRPFASRPSSTEEARLVIRFALDHGIRLLDASESNSLDPHRIQRLIRDTLSSWRGSSGEVKILVRTGGSGKKRRYLQDAESLKKYADECLSTLGISRLSLLLHDCDPHLPFDETLEALAQLHRSGKVAHLGLCNVTTAQLHEARKHFPVAAVLSELSVLSRKCAAEGLLTIAKEQGIAFFAQHPLGGRGKAPPVLASNPVLVPISQRHHCSPQELALAALLDAGPHIVPMIEASRIESVKSCIHATRITLDISDRTALEFSGMSFAPDPECLAAARALFPVAQPVTNVESVDNTKQKTKRHAKTKLALRPGAICAARPCFGFASSPEVVMIIGIPGAGKAFLASDYVDQGYFQVKRNPQGKLIPFLDRALSTGKKLIVLDGAYPTRKSRAPIIASARAHGIPIRCVHLQTSLADAQVNIVTRMMEQYGRLLEPGELKAGSTHRPSPGSVERWIRTFEGPSREEGFAAVERVPFVHRPKLAHKTMGLLLDAQSLRRVKSGATYPQNADDVELLPGRFETLIRWVAQGYHLFFACDTDSVAQGQRTRKNVEEILQRTAELLKLPVTEIVCCSHEASPITCWCRRPMPGMGVYLIERHELARKHLIVVGDRTCDLEFAAALGARFVHMPSSFSDNPRLRSRTTNF